MESLATTTPNSIFFTHTSSFRCNLDLRVEYWSGELEQLTGISYNHLAKQVLPSHSQNIVLQDLREKIPLVLQGNTQALAFQTQIPKPIWFILLLFPDYSEDANLQGAEGKLFSFYLQEQELDSSTLHVVGGKLSRLGFHLTILNKALESVLVQSNPQQDEPINWDEVTKDMFWDKVEASYEGAPPREVLASEPIGACQHYVIRNRQSRENEYLLLIQWEDYRILFISRQIFSHNQALKPSSDEPNAYFVTMHRPDGILVYASPEFPDLLGYSMEELIGKSLYSLVQDDFQPEIKDLSLKTELGKDFYVEFPMIHRNGKLCWFNTNLRFIQGRPGKTPRILANHTDISELKHQGSQLKRGNEFYQYLYKESPISLFIVEYPQHRLRDFNDAAVNQYGFNREELLNMPFTDLCYAEDQERIEAMYPQLLDKASVELLEFRQFKKGGKEFFVNLYFHRFHYLDYEAYLVMVVDIDYKARSSREIQRLLEAERKLTKDLRDRELNLLDQLEISLKLNREVTEVNERFYALNDCSPIGILMSDPKGNCIWSNRQLQEISGLALDQILDQAWINIIHPQDRPLLQKKWQDLVQDQQSLKLECRLIHPEQGIRWLSLSSAPMNHAQRGYMGEVISFEDISQTKEAENLIDHISQLKNLLIEISVDFINIEYEQFSDTFSQALEKFSRIAGFDRISIILFYTDQNRARLAYEYYTPDILSRAEGVLDYDLNNHAWWVEQINNRVTLSYDNIDQMPPQAVHAKNAFKHYDIQSLVAVPMAFQKDILGFAGFATIKEARHWDPEAIEILNLLTSIFSNVIHRFQIKQLLQTSQNQYALLANNISDLVTLQSGDLLFSYVSPSVRKMLGYKPEDLMGDSLLDFVLADDISFIQQQLEICWQGHETSFSYRLRTVWNSHIWVESTFKAIEHEGRSYLLGVTQDTSDKKHVLNQLEENRKLLATIFNESTDAIMIVDVHNGQIQNCNQRAVDLMEAEDKMELIGIAANSMVMHKESAKNLSEILRSTEQTSLTTREIKCRTRKGNRFWGNFAIKKFLFAGRWIQLMRVTDISQRKNDEVEIDKLLKDTILLNNELREHNHKLEKTNAELDHFVYSVSHDLRSPVVSAMGVMNLIQEEEDSQDKLAHLPLINRSLKKLDHFIRDIVDFSWNQRKDLEIKLIDFDNLLQNAWDKQYDALSSVEVDLKAHINVPKPFYSDPKRLDIVFNNLFSNAIKYADGNKDLSEVKVDIQGNQHEVKILIEDNGIGIRRKYLSRIFDMFFRATEKSEGSGIGLYILREALEKIHGTVLVSSKWGTGTRFVIKMPNLKSRLKNKPRRPFFS